MQKITPRDAKRISGSTKWINEEINNKQIDAKLAAKVQAEEQKNSDPEEEQNSAEKSFNNFEESEEESEIVREAKILMGDYCHDTEKIPWRKMVNIYGLDNATLIKIACKKIQAKKEKEREEDYKNAGGI